MEAPRLGEGKLTVCLIGSCDNDVLQIIGDGWVENENSRMFVVSCVVRLYFDICTFTCPSIIQ